MQKGGAHGGQRFREGAETEARERRDRRAAVEVGPAETFGPDDLPVHGNGHRQARQVVPCDQFARAPPRLLHGSRVPVDGRGGRRRRHRRGIDVHGLPGHVPDGAAARDQDEHGRDDDERRLGTPACRSHNA